MTPGTEELPTEMGALAEKLTEAHKVSLLFGKCGLPAYVEERSGDCICAAPMCDSLCDLGLAYPRERYPGGIVLTPLGLALRAHLQANPIPTSDSKTE